MKDNSFPDPRPAEANDAAELVRLRVALYGGDEVEHALEVEQFFQGACGDPVIIVMTRAGGGLGGFVEVGTRPYAEGCLTSPVAYIEGWYVDPDLRRMGLGRALLQAAERWAQDQGHTEMASDARIDNEISLEAHRAMGFAEVERIVCLRKRL